MASQRTSSKAQRALERFRPRTAWQPYYPLGTNPWNVEKVAHLFRRAAFGASWETVQKVARATPAAAVSYLMRGGSGPDREAFENEYHQLRKTVMRGGDRRQYQALWAFRLLYSPHPLQERMTLFWHNHFATSNAKVNHIRLMQRQQDVLRQHALGYFGELLQEMTRDPAMIVWLDSNTNKKGRPNENYAREVFELFGLGVGHYTEGDIGEAARALTGWDVRDGRAVFHPGEHDDGLKTIFGRKGKWAAGDVVRLILEHPACAPFLVRKIFRELVSETAEPSPQMIAPLADEFRVRNYHIGWLVERLLRSWVFYSPAALRQKVKSPVDFLAGSVKMLEGQMAPAVLSEQAEALGQALFYPPSVKGWDGGRNWITSSTLLRRQNIAFRLSRAPSPGVRTDPASLIEKYGIEGEAETARFFCRLFLQNETHDALPRIVEHLQQVRQKLWAQLHTAEFVRNQLAREAAHLVMTLPEFQLG